MSDGLDEEVPDSPQGYARHFGLTSSFLTIAEALIPPLSQATSLDDLYDPFRDQQVQGLSTRLEQWTVNGATQQCLVQVLEQNAPQDDVFPSRLHPRELHLELPILHGDHDTQLRILLERHRNVTKASEIIADLAKLSAIVLTPSALIKDAIIVSQSALRLMQDSFDISSRTLVYMGIRLAVAEGEGLTCDYLKGSSPSNIYRREEVPIFPLLGSIDSADTKICCPPSNRLMPPAAEEHILWTQGMVQGVSMMLDESFEGLGSSDIHDLMELDTSESSTCEPHQTSSSAMLKSITDLRVTSPIMPVYDRGLGISADTPSRHTFPSPPHSNVFNLIDDDEMTTILRGLAGPEQARVNAILAAERLVEIDTTLKLRPPPVPQHEPAVPWLVDTAVDVASLMGAIQRPLTAYERRWSGISKIERRLQWTPFAVSLAAVSVEDCLPFEEHPDFDYPGSSMLADMMNVEKLECDLERLLSTHDHHLAPLQDRVSSELGTERLAPTLYRSSLVKEVASTNVSRYCDPMLHAPADQASSTPGVLNFNALLKKRKLELVDVAAFASGGSRDGVVRPPSDTLLSEYAQTFTGGLSGFMKAHGRHVANAPTITPQYKAEPLVASLRSGSLALSRAEELPRQLPFLHDEHSGQTARQIIVSSSMITRRAMMDDLQRALLSTAFIERSGTLDEVYAEADITIAPTSGIYLTTIQKISQKALPGQQSRTTGARAVVESLSTRYDQLTILVSSGDDTSRMLTTHDSEALSDLINWTSSLPTSIDVLYVAGGQSELCGWIAGLVQKYMPAGFHLAEEESMWERLLRMAGLNAFAAQKVLAGLKSWPGREESCAGDLARLLAVSRAERAAFIDGLALSGMVLRKLDRLAEASWFKRA